jgi:hypothetical protein
MQLGGHGLQGSLLLLIAALSYVFHARDAERWLKNSPATKRAKKGEMQL